MCIILYEPNASSPLFLSRNKAARAASALVFRRTRRRGGPRGIRRVFAIRILPVVLLLEHLDRVLDRFSARVLDAAFVSLRAVISAPRDAKTRERVFVLASRRRARQGILQEKRGAGLAQPRASWTSEARRSACSEKQLAAAVSTSFGRGAVRRLRPRAHPSRAAAQRRRSTRPRATTRPGRPVRAPRVRAASRASRGRRRRRARLDPRACFSDYVPEPPTRTAANGSPGWNRRAR